MASTQAKQLCANCTKGGGITICVGCQGCFCKSHFHEHRLSLDDEMSRVSQHQDYLYRSVTGNNVAHPLLSHIDDWEQSSIRKIQEVAEKARNDLARYINDMKSQLKQSLLKLKSELESSHEADDYTEIELTDWMEQLEKLRRMFENPPAIEIVDDQAQPLIRVIQRKGFETKKISDTNIASALSKTTSTIASASFITKEVPTKLDAPTNNNKKSEAQQFTVPGVFKEPDCKGRLCAKCGNCRDWYYTGDAASWKWIKNFKNWGNSDWERWNDGKYWDRFKRRDGATCTARHFSGRGFHRGGGNGITGGCLCEDNISV